MSKSIIHSYNAFRSTKTEKDDIYKVDFRISGVPPSVSNAIRRVLLGQIPIAAFDDNYMENPDENHIKIKKNISALHNEFVSHRLSLLPICMYRNSSMKIQIDYDFDNCDFVYRFENSEAVPTFLLNIKNDEEARQRLGANPDNSINITSDLITIENPDDFNKVDEFMIRDYITGGYVLLHKLKPVSSNEDVQDAEELEIVMKPNINVGRYHARYCPVGTVSYEFEKDSQDVQDRYFQKYIEALQKQRKDDKLELFNEQDIKTFRGSFNVMGSERIYKRNELDEPETVVMCVETVGNLEAHQLVFDAIEIIRLKTIVLMNVFEWEEKAQKYSYNPKKVQIQKNSQSGFIEITIFKEDHTLGNLISSYLKKLFITDKIFGEMLSFGSYKMPHPLEEKIVVVMGFKEGADFSKLFAKFGLKSGADEINRAIQCLFIVCSYYLKIIGTMKADWKGLSQIQEASFSLANHELLRGSYYDKSAAI